MEIFDEVGVRVVVGGGVVVGVLISVTVGILFFEYFFLKERKW